VDSVTRAAENGICFKATNIMILNGSMMKRCVMVCTRFSIRLYAAAPPLRHRKYCALIIEAKGDICGLPLNKFFAERFQSNCVFSAFLPFPVFLHPEMEFLDISLTKAPVSFYWRISKKTTLYSGFNNTNKKISETRKLESFHEGRSPYKNSSQRRL
jgi:hypothetical protein